MAEKNSHRLRRGKKMESKRSIMRDFKLAKSLFDQHPNQNVMVVLKKGNKLLDFVFGKNIVTTTGDIHMPSRPAAKP